MSERMFRGNCIIRRTVISPEEVRDIVSTGIVPFINSWNNYIIEALKIKYGINVAVPVTQPVVVLEHGDSLITVSVSNMPNLNYSRAYTKNEIETMVFEFVYYEVIGMPSS